MKRNSIICIIACGASLALCQGLHAQDASPAPATSGADAGGGGHQRGGGRGGYGMSLERLTTALGLTTDEQTQIKPILDQERTDMQGLRADTSTTPQDRMAKAKDIRDAANAKITAILTPDQQTKFAAMLEKMKNRRMRGGGGGGGGGTDAGAAPSAAPSASAGQ